MLAELKAHGFNVTTPTFYRWRRNGLAGFIERGKPGWARYVPVRCEISSWENFVAVIVPAYYAGKPAKRGAAGRASGEARRGVTDVRAPTPRPALVANAG